VTFDYATPDALVARQALYRRYVPREASLEHWIAERVRPLVMGSLVLDLGSGLGGVWRIAGQSARLLVLSDRSEAMLRSSVMRDCQNTALMVATADRLPFGNASMDLITAFAMLYHVDDTLAVFREVGRVLTASGTFVATTFGDHHLRQLCAFVEEHAGQSSNLFPRTFLPSRALAQLNQYFECVELVDYRYAFRVDDATLLWSYVKSTPLGRDLDPRAATTLQRALHAAVRAEGFALSTELTMFVCTRARSTGARSQAFPCAPDAPNALACVLACPSCQLPMVQDDVSSFHCSACGQRLSEKEGVYLSS
jgi:SAM-dependent methyltransferase